MPSATNALATNRACGVPGLVVGMGVGDAAEIFERANVVAGDAVAFRIHAAELPLRHCVAIRGGVFERGHAALVSPDRSACVPERNASRRRLARQFERRLPEGRESAPAAHPDDAGATTVAGGASGADEIAPRGTDRPRPQEPRRHLPCRQTPAPGAKASDQRRKQQQTLRYPHNTISPRPRQDG